MGYDVVVLGSVQSYVSVLELNFLLAMSTLGCTRVKLSQKSKERRTQATRRREIQNIDWSAKK